MTFENLRSFFLLFSFISASAYSQSYAVLISEVMADPNPPRFLPAHEYMELYNKGNSPVNLCSWSLNIGTHTVILPEVYLNPEEYIIVCDEEAKTAFEIYGKTLAIRNLPALSNDGQTIVLKSSSSELIHYVTYNPEWYATAEKRHGGYSLEIIDTDNPCGREENWSESMDESGGTPGKRNSVMTKNPDNMSPVLIRATLPSDNILQLFFNENLDISGAQTPDYYSVNNGFYNPDSVLIRETDPSKVLLYYTENFKSNKVYTVTVLPEIHDCTGNRLESLNFIDFSFTEKSSESDVVINEILFNAGDVIPEFIELYNCSDHTFDLSQFVITLFDAEDLHEKKMMSFKDYPYMLMPGAFVAVTKDSKKLLSAYPDALRYTLEHKGMFNLADQSGIIRLSDTLGLVIDSVAYSYQMHNKWIKEDKGISLERVNPETPSIHRGNWQSASGLHGYASPGSINSQFVPDTVSFSMNLIPEFLSPNGDGFNEEVLLNLRFSDAGWIGSIMIYSLGGNRIKTLVKNEVLGSEVQFLWDGKKDDGQTAEPGLYIFFGELFRTTGETKSFKKVVPLIMK